MELNEFIVKILLRGTISIPVDAIYIPSENNKKVVRIDPAFLKALKRLTSDIDYRCDFDNTGVCKRNRKLRLLYDSTFHIDDRPAGAYIAQRIKAFFVAKKINARRHDMGCCGGCGTTVGFINQIFWADLHIYAQHYNEKTGFWKKNVGCTLPRELRSSVCILHHCGLELSQNEPKLHKAMITLSLIEDVANTWESYLEWCSIKRGKHQMTDYHNLPQYINERLEQSLGNSSVSSPA